MKKLRSELSMLVLLAGCAAASSPSASDPTPAAAEGPDCASSQPWTRAARALGRPVVQSAGAQGKPSYIIKGVSYADIMRDRDLTEGVKLVDPRGLAPEPTTIFNIVWTTDDVATESSRPGAGNHCTERYSAPTFIEVR